MSKNFRSPNYNLIKNIEKKVDKNTILRIFSKMSRIRYFEKKIKETQISNPKKVMALLYLSLGK